MKHHTVKRWRVMEV